MTKREKICFITIGVLIIGLICTILYATHKKDDLIIANNNIAALTDSICSYEMKNGELLQVNHSLVIEKEELENYLGITKQEVKDLEKKLKTNLQYISKLECEVRTDTIYIETEATTTDSLNYRYSFMKVNDYYSICGYTDVNENHTAFTTITDNTMYLDLKVGMDDKWKIFVQTDNPYVSFKTIDGALLDKDLYLKREKQKRFGVSVQVGFGAQYGLMHRRFDYGPYVGVGFNYSFLIW